MPVNTTEFELVLWARVLLFRAHPFSVARSRMPCCCATVRQRRYARRKAMTDASTRKSRHNLVPAASFRILLLFPMAAQAPDRATEWRTRRQGQCASARCQLSGKRILEPGALSHALSVPRVETPPSELELPTRRETIRRQGGTRGLAAASHAPTCSILARPHLYHSVIFISESRFCPTAGADVLKPALERIA